MDNAAIYKKVSADDGALESLNDKRTLCLLLRKALLIVLETLCSKLFGFTDIDKLEEMVKFSREISHIVFNTVHNICQVEVQKLTERHGIFFPLICQARQFEIHTLLCYMATTLHKTKEIKYFENCRKVGVLNKFLTTLQPAKQFLDKFVIDNPHFHDFLPPPHLNLDVGTFRNITDLYTLICVAFSCF